MTPLQKKRDELCDEMPSRRDAFRNGWNAMYAEHERIVKGLIKCIEFYSDKTNFNTEDTGRNYIPSYRAVETNPETYADETVGTLAKKALEAYKRECGVK